MNMGDEEEATNLMKTGAIETIEMDLLLEAVYRRCGYDFRNYARASVERRTRQFLSSSGCSTLSDMIARVLRDERFLSRYVQYLSVTVTELFRDPFVFQAVREQIIPLLRTWPHVKVWCAGCATGEEVYSLAIVLKEEGLYEKSVIYATDFNDASLEQARQAVYPADKIREATRNYQQSGGKQFFSHYYHAHYGAAALDGTLKERITFANHNLVTDQVFGEMHLVFCRNVLIYFNRDLQERVLELFTESLVHGGILCLGTKEDLQFTRVSARYELVNCKAKLYKKKDDYGTRL
jgi:chemotaxis protein methyltransferase CheR